MKILICEDEKPTAERLIQLLNQYSSEVEILSVVDSVESALKWFNSHSQPDLIFQDIELSDGNCFQIFEKIEIVSPIIFTTAYSDYALKSFSQNSIDYLVKPYDLEDVRRSMEKFRKLRNVFQLPHKTLLEKILKSPHKKSRFLVKLGSYYKTIQADEIALIQFEDGVSVAYLFSGEKHLMDQSLNELENELDSKLFFRINRSIIINFQSIHSIQQWFSGRLKLVLNDELSVKQETLVSRSRASDFKSWLGS